MYHCCQDWRTLMPATPLLHYLPLLQTGPELQRAEHHSGGLGEVERGRGPGRRAHGGHRARHHAEEVPPTHQVPTP